MYDSISGLLRNSNTTLLRNSNTTLKEDQVDQAVHDAITCLPQTLGNTLSNFIQSVALENNKPFSTKSLALVVTALGGKLHITRTLECTPFTKPPTIEESIKVSFTIIIDPSKHKSDEGRFTISDLNAI